MTLSDEEVLITVHGIRTFGQWQNRLKALVKKENPKILVESYRYGYFSVIAFFFPFFRWFAVRAFQQNLRELLERHKGAPISIVAHSFGTHIVAWGLRGLKADEMPYVRILILSGSVLKSNFNWELLLRTGRLRRVVNDCGINDSILVLSQLFVFLTGMAGKIGFFGFINDRKVNRYFFGGHSHYFLPKGLDPDSFMHSWWVPLLAHDRPTEEHDERESPRPMEGLWYAIIQAADPIKLVLWAALAYSTYHVGVKLPRESAVRFEQANAVVRDAADLLTSGDTEAAIAKALGALEQFGLALPRSYDVVYNALFNASPKLRAIDVGSFSYRALVKRTPSGELLIVTERGLSKWSSEGVLRFRHNAPLMSSTSFFSPDGTAVFFGAGTDSINRLDTTTRHITEHSMSMDYEERPGTELLALDATRLLSCRNKVLSEFAPNSAGELIRKWHSEIKVDGDCSLLHQRTRNQILIGTSKAEIVLFDVQTKQLLRTISRGVEITNRRAYGMDSAGDYVLVDYLGEDILFGISEEKRYRLKNAGLSPMFSKDGRFLIYRTTRPMRLIIVDLMKPGFLEHEVECVCVPVSPLGESQFLTLDLSREISVRNLPLGDLVSNAFVFESDVNQALFFEDQKLVLGLRPNDVASLGRIGRRDNSLEYGLSSSEYLDDILWLSDTAILLETSTINGRALSSKRNAQKVLVQKTGDFEVVWSSQRKELSKDGNPWAEVVGSALVESRKDISFEEWQIEQDAEGRLLGQPFDVKVSGDMRVVARQVPDGIALVDRAIGNVVITVPHGNSKVSSIWVAIGRKIVAAGFQDGSIKLWSPAIASEPIASLSGKGSEVSMLKSNPSQSLLASADRRGYVRIWPLLSPEQLVDSAKSQKIRQQVHGRLQ